MFSLLPLMGGAMNSENKQPLNCASAVHEFCRCVFKTSIFPCISDQNLFVLPSKPSYKTWLGGSTW